jgi:GntR family transcriptional regulator, transcriptional repressor for pyruvate dehydrogenase complex
MSTTSDRGGLTIAPVSVPKASDVLAHELRERILSGAVAEGEALPSERELVEQTQLSRTTVREALRILEVQGLLRIKVGRSGGAFVRRPDVQSVADSVELLVRGRRIRLSSLHETREAVEPSCAVLAARNRTDADLAAIEFANEAMQNAGDDLSAFLDANVAWHVSVARAGGNELLSSFMQAISKAIYLATEYEDFIDAEVREQTLQVHRRITDAIREQDEDAADRRMRRHVHAFATELLATDQREAIELT